MIYSRVDLYRPSSSHLQKQKLYIWSGQRLTGFPKQARFLRVYSTSLLKSLWGKEKLLVMSNFSFSHSVFYPFGDLSAFFIKLKIVVSSSVLRGLEQFYPPFFLHFRAIFNPFLHLVPLLNNCKVFRYIIQTHHHMIYI